MFPKKKKKMSQLIGNICLEWVKVIAGNQIFKFSCISKFRFGWVHMKVPENTHFKTG